MRLTIKIMSLILLIIITLLAVDGYLSVKRETELFKNDMKGDAHLLGSAMKGLIYDVWRVKGQGRALELIKQANIDNHQMRIRWVWLDALPGDPYEPSVSKKTLDPLVRGQEIFVEETSNGGKVYLHTYVPVPVNNERHGALEISEPLSELTDYIHESIVRSFVLAVLLAVASGLVLLMVGVGMIGRPLNRLLEKTRRIGVGDFSVDLELRGRDELSGLAAAMNRMCEQLTAGQEALHNETEARISAIEQLRHTERLSTLGRLSSGMAHELGTPLNVVAGRAKLIATGELEKEEITECTRIIGGQVERMTNIIQQLLDFARRRKSQKAPADLQGLVGQILEMLNPTARKQRVTLELIKNNSIPLVAIDQSQMQQVLINLVMNGIQAMPDGGRLEVGLHLKRTRHRFQADIQDKEYLALYVKDEGEGVAEEDLNHIFDPFFTTKDVGTGTGLGLSIVYGIVQEHNGWIDVESKVGEGTCVTVYLPVEVDECKGE